MKHRAFTREAKAKAVARVAAGETQAAVATDLNISSSMISYWVKHYSGSKLKEDKQPTTKGNTHDALIYLRHARSAINNSLKKGNIKHMDRAHLYTLLALDALEGG